MKKVHAILALSAAFLISPFLSNSLSQTVAGYNASLQLNETKVNLSNETMTTWYVRIAKNGSQENRFLISFYFPAGTSDFATGGLFRGTADTDYSKSAERIMQLNVWHDHLFIGDENDNYTPLAPYLEGDCYTAVTASNVGFDFTIPMTANMRSLKILEGTQLPTVGFATNGTAGSAGANDVFTIERTAVYNIAPAANPSFAAPTMQGIRGYEFNTQEFELTPNALTCWFVKTYDYNRYALAFKLPDEVSDYDGTYTDINGPLVPGLSIWKDHIYFILNDGTELAMTPFETARTRVIITNARQYQIDFSLPTGFNLSSITGIRIKEGTQFPTLAFTKGIDTSKYDANTVLETSRDAVYCISMSPSYDATKPGSNPFVFSDYTDYEKDTTEIDGANVSFTLMKNGTQANRYRLYFRFPQTMVDFHTIDPNILDGRTENTYLAGLNWKREHIFFDSVSATAQGNHEGWVSYAKRGDLAEISFDLNIYLDEAATLTVLAGTEFPSYAYASGMPNSVNTNTKLVYTLKEAITVDLEPNPEYTGNSGSQPFVFSSTATLKSKKDEAKAELNAIDVSIYLEEDQDAVRQAIEDGKAAIDNAITGNAVTTALAEAKETISNFRTAEYYHDLEAATAVIELIDAIGEVTVNSGETIANAREAYDALSDGAKKLVGSEKLKVLTDAEEKYVDMVETAAVNAVIDAIHSIGEVTLAKAETIANARKAYDALSEKAKERIPAEDVATLEKAEARIAELTQARTSALVVEDKIWNIGTVTLESELAIVSAREAYESLNDLAKTFVSAEAYDALIEAENTLVQLKADQKAQDEANDVIDLINAIGTVDANSGSAIAAARAAYDALSTEAKTKVSEESLKKLTDAEKRFEEIKNGGGSKGCGGSIAGASVILAFASIGAAIMLKKKKEK